MRFAVPVPGSGDAGLSIRNNNQNPNDDNIEDVHQLPNAHDNHVPQEVVQQPIVDVMRKVTKLRILNNRFRLLCLNIERYENMPSTSQNQSTTLESNYIDPGERPSLFHFNEEQTQEFSKKFTSRRNRNSFLDLDKYDKSFSSDEEDYDASSTTPDY